ncbi:MAG: S8 family serine peptidase [Candidatus Thorarchaeota archaeon]
MRRGFIGTLLVVFIVFPFVPSIFVFDAGIQDSQSSLVSPMDFHTLASIHGNSIPVVVEFSRTITTEDVEHFRAIGVRFSFDTPERSRFENYYLLRGSPGGLDYLREQGYFLSISLQTTGDQLQPMRDVSIPEIGADDVWKMVDGLGQNLTGEGLLIADLDSGVDWRHPDLWFADGGVYDWLDVFSPAGPTNGSDAIDLDDSGLASSDEILRWIDIDRDGTFNASTDWMWVDGVGNDSVIQASEPFFVVNDTNSNDALDLGEKLVRLSTPKTRYIVEMDGDIMGPNRLVWQRGVNLTTSTHEDTDGHGTAVAGIMLGGQLGYRKYVGVAPDAELMMIKVFGADYTYLSVDEGLVYARDNGADVILIEVGKWWEEFLDGSSATESLIDSIVQAGIPVITPSGNLGGENKHAKAFVLAPSAGHIMDFIVPNPQPTDPWFPNEIERVRITILTVNDTDFTNANFTIGVPIAAVPPLSYTLLHPNYGEKNWGMDLDPVSGVNFQSYVWNSGRGTKMMYIEMWRSGGLSPFPHGRHINSISLWTTMRRCIAT